MKEPVLYEDLDNGDIKIKKIVLPLNDEDSEFVFWKIEDLECYIRAERENLMWLKNSETYPKYTGIIFSDVEFSFINPLENILLLWRDIDALSYNNDYYKSVSKYEEPKKKLKDIISDFSKNLKRIDFPFHSRLISNFIRNQPEEISIGLMYFILSGRIEEKADFKDSIFRGATRCSRENGWSVELEDEFMKLEPYLYRAAAMLENYYQFGESSDVDYLRKRVESLEEINKSAQERSSELDEFVQGLKSNIDNWVTRFIESNETEQKEQKVRAENFSRRLARDLLRKSANYQKEINHKYESSLQTVEQAKDTYLSQVELDASVQYWKAKGATHKRSKNLWMGGLFSLVAMIALPPYLLHGRFSGADSTVTAESTVGVLNSLGTNPLELVSTILAISAISYLIKFFAKQYSTQHHLYLEAEERKVMLMTYLALMKEDKLKEKEDRKVALDTLFRPAQTGIFKDANHNIVPSDTIVKIFEKQSSKSN